MLPSHVSVTDFGVFAVVAIFGLIVTLLFLMDFRKSGKGTTIPGPEASDSETGNLTDMGKAGSLHEYMLKLHQDYGPITAFWFGKTYVVSLASPEYWKEANPLFDRPVELFKLFEPLIGKKSIQYGNGPMGRKRRQFMDRSFSHEAVKDYYAAFEKVAKETAEKLGKLPAEEQIPLGEIMLAMAIKAICVAGMGRQLANEDQIPKLSTAYEIAWHEMERQLTEGPPEPGSQQEQEYEKVMTWCIYYLATHPDIQEKVYEEIVEVLGDMDPSPQVASEFK